MSPVELMALSLGLSVVVAALASLAAAGLCRLTGDPTLRDRTWAWALYLPVLPPLLVAATLLAPAPVRPILISPASVLTTELVEPFAIAATPVSTAVIFSMGQSAIATLGFAGTLVLVRLASLVLRALRLNRLIGRAGPASVEASTVVAECAALLDVLVPIVRTGRTGADAFLAGLRRPVLVLPHSLASAPNTPAARAIITHELAHLKRGDHRSVWVEEAVVAALAINLILPFIRARRAAAREEACDALALFGAEPADRRAYAQSLIDALRSHGEPKTLPALTFNGTTRSQAMRRLNYILTPPTTAGRPKRLMALATGLSLLIMTSLATTALASKREAEPSPARQEEVALQQVDPDGSAGMAQAAARIATATATNELTPDQRERFRDPAVTEYRHICTSSDPADEGFCSGVIFSQLGSSGVCPPDAVNVQDPAVSGPALHSLVRRARAEFAAIPAREAETLPKLALAALRRAYPCGGVSMEADGISLVNPTAQGELQRPAAGKTRLSVKIGQGPAPMVLADGYVLNVRLVGQTATGANRMSMDFPLPRGTGIDRTVFFDLDDRYFPKAMPASTYALEAEIHDRAGQVVYAAQPSTIRLAPMSQGSLGRMQPELTLSPVTSR